MGTGVQGGGRVGENKGDSCRSKRAAEGVMCCADGAAVHAGEVKGGECRQGVHRARGGQRHTTPSPVPAHAHAPV